MHESKVANGPRICFVNQPRIQVPAEDPRPAGVLRVVFYCLMFELVAGVAIGAGFWFFRSR
jgi:hypothetical protein